MIDFNRIEKAGAAEGLRNEIRIYKSLILKSIEENGEKLWETGNEKSLSMSLLERAQIIEALVNRLMVLEKSPKENYG